MEVNRPEGLPRLQFLLERAEYTSPWQVLCRPVMTECSEMQGQKESSMKDTAPVTMLLTYMNIEGLIVVQK
jgi:hypothetical protein